MSLRHSYTLLAPLYDFGIARATLKARRHSLTQLTPTGRVLIAGIGTGLDIPLLPSGPQYLAYDLTPAMLTRARQRAHQHSTPISLLQADAAALPYADASFDTAVLHLILAVAPQPRQTLAETVRTLRPGGRILIFDKFLRPGQKAPLRRLLSPLVGQIATRTDVVFEDILNEFPQLDLITDQAALVGGWFRHIVLQKRAD